MTTTTEEIFKKRANDAERLLSLAIDFLWKKDLYNEWMKWKENI